MKINPFVGVFLATVGVLVPLIVGLFAWQETRFARIEAIMLDMSATLAEHGARLTGI